MSLAPPESGRAGMEAPILRAAMAALIVVIAAAALGLIWLLLVAPPHRSYYVLVGDDAGYYLAVARNFCLGHGYSFDRINATNGFNPLMAWLLIGGFRLAAPGLALEACYRIGNAIGLIAMAVAMVATWRLLSTAIEPTGLRGAARRLVLLACAAFVALFLAWKSYYGMDAPLVLALGTVVLVRVARHGLLAPGWRAAVTDGLLLAALFLARVDTLPLLVAAFALMAWVSVGRRAMGALLVRLAVVAAAVTPFLLWGFRNFGTWLPVSARLKTGFPHPDLGQSLAAIRSTSLNPADQLSWAVAGLVAAVWVWTLLAELRAGRRPEPPAAGIPMVTWLLGLYLVARFGYMLLFSRMDVQGSYVILAHVANLLAFVLVVGRLHQRGGTARPWVAPAAGATLALIALVLFAGKWRTMERWADRATPGGRGDEIALARAFHDATGPGDVLYGGAFGLMGFFSDRRWINGDGVANNYDYQRAFAAPGGLEGYLAGTGVTHVVMLCQPPDPPELGGDGERITARVRGVMLGLEGRFTVRAGDEVARGETPRRAGAKLCLVRYRPPPGPAR